VTGFILADREQEELYVLLKPREDVLTEPLEELLRRIEQALFQRLTIAEIEALASRFNGGR
jgi:hypothetical protein